MTRALPILLATTLLAGLSLAPARAASDDELLPAEQAFRLNTRALDGQTVEATWTIAPGYYMYRDKFRFEVLDSGVTLKPAVTPPGKIKQDPGFGAVETYTRSVSVRLPLERQDRSARNLKLRITGQGCNEPVGVCYPPLTQEVSLALPALAAAGGGGGSLDTLSGLAGLLSPRGSAEPLPVDQAFRADVRAIDARTLRAELLIAPGYYLYRDKVRFDVSGATLGKVSLPAGDMKDVPTLDPKASGLTAVYHGNVVVDLPLSAARGALEVTAHYQGCAERGICYPPTSKRFKLSLPAAGTAAAPAAAAAVVSSTDTSPPPAATPGRASRYLLAMLAAFGTGLLLTFTPCVLPMIPILSSVIVGQRGEPPTKLRGGLLAGSYVLGTATTYTVAGILAGASGDQLQAYFQNVWGIGIASALFVLLALAMFGMYELQMPAAIQSRLHVRTQNLRGGSFMGTYVLGLVSALIVGACVSPLLISALGVAISSRDPVLGGLIMLAMALGMGVVLVAVGVGAGYLLPKAGPWMNTVKYVFGVLLLAVAIYLLGLLPQVPVLLLWATLFIVVGVYLGATQALSVEAGGWAYLWKGIGTLLLVWGVLALIGGFMGERDLFKPLPRTGLGAVAGPTASAATPASDLFAHLTTVEALDAQLAQARNAGRPVLIDYYATWCTDCVRMERTTLADPAVQSALARFALIKADVTDNDTRARALKQRYGVFGPPTMVVLDSQGRELTALRFSGYRDSPEFLAILNRVHP